MTTSAARLEPQNSPADAILMDCQTALEAIDAGLKELIARRAAPLTIKRQVQQLHMLKGATSLAGLEGLSQDLHQLEGDLLDALRGPMSFTDARMISRSLDAAFRHLETRRGPAPDADKNVDMKPFGESLWWSTQMVQITARELGKRVFLMVRGGEHQIHPEHFLVLQSSLQHLTRNAVVHGIELPEDRREAGKPGLGLIRISGHMLANSFVVNVLDNGAGVSDEERETMFDLGASHASRVTRAAGRGVGLSAVRDSVRSVSGTVTVRSVPGRGTAFTIRLPN